MFVYSSVLLFIFGRIVFIIMYYIAHKTGISTLRSLGFILTVAPYAFMILETMGYKIYGNNHI